jgi:hypothetical protein
MKVKITLADGEQINMNYDEFIETAPPYALYDKCSPCPADHIKEGDFILYDGSFRRVRSVCSAATVYAKGCPDDVTPASPKMKLESFYCSMDDVQGKRGAEKKRGYIDGEIGVYRKDGAWIPIHIPTGMALVPTDDDPKSMIQCAEAILNGCADILARYMKTKAHEEFIESKKESEQRDARNVSG